MPPMPTAEISLPLDSQHPSTLKGELAAATRLAAPVVLVQLGLMLMGVVDTLMLGWVSAQALAAGALGHICTASLLMLGAGILAALDPLVAQAYGAGDRKVVGAHLQRGVVLAVGMSLPFGLVLWDVEGVLRALALEAQVILQATNVDGVFTGDQRQDPSATLIRELTYQEAIIKNYAVMDANAFGLCKANQLPIVVFNINQPGAIKRVLEGDRDIGTIVR